MVPQPRAPPPPRDPEEPPLAHRDQTKTPHLADETQGAGVEADFESAIRLVGWGRFHWYLLGCCVPAFWSAVAVTGALSFVLAGPAARDQLRLDPHHHGTLHAATYAGMIVSALAWGYLSDTLGRRGVITWGFLGSGAAELLSAASQDLRTLLVGRFLAGFMFSGPFASLLTYVAETQRAERRAAVLLYTSMLYTLAGVTLPMLAWWLLSLDVHVVVVTGHVELRAWNVFLAAASVAPLLTAACCSRLPESPKFLMSRGRHQEALRVFQLMFAANTGRPPSELPVKRLACLGVCGGGEGDTSGGAGAALRGGFRQLAPLFLPPHRARLAFLCALHAGFMLGSNTLRLWQPALAAAMSADTGAGDVCAGAEGAGRARGEPGASVYLQSAAISAASLVTYAGGGAAASRCGRRVLAAACGVACGVCVATLPAAGGGGAVCLLAATLALLSLASTSLSSLALDLFPTELRAMAMAVFLMVGRLGTVGGNIAFPPLLALGCLPPFLAVAAVVTGCGLGCCAVPSAPDSPALSDKPLPPTALRSPRASQVSLPLPSHA